MIYSADNTVRKSITLAYKYWQDSLENSLHYFTTNDLELYTY